MEKSRIYSGIAIMLGLMVLGFQIPKAVSNYRSYDRVVDVKGLCEREVKSDKVIWPLVYKIVSDDLGALYEQTAVKNAIVIDFLKSAGMEESEISVSLPSISDKFANEYGSNDRIYRYIVTNVITLCTDKVDLALDLMKKQSELIKKGIVFDSNNWNNPVEFKYEGLNDIKPSMIEEATKNARMAAEKFAKDSGSRLGKIKSASQGTFSIENRDSNTPHIKRVRVVTYVTYYLKN